MLNIYVKIMKEKYTFYPIEGFEGYFLGKGEGENDWKVFSNKNGELKEKEGSIGERGHILYCLYTDGKRVGKHLHVLIAMVFIPIPQELLEGGEKLHVHHIDHNPLNNAISNLIWMTASEHRRLHKKGKIPKANPPKQVFQYSLDGKLVKIWPSTAECERNGFAHGHVVNCCNGRLKQHKGYRWSYEPLP